MALSSIVKNIYTFANILSQAGTEAVKTWNDKSLQNAFNWAAYCMKIAEQTKHSSFRNDLDVQVQSFTVLLKPCSLLYLTLDSLTDASQILCKRLLENPHCPNDIIEKVVESQKTFMTDVLEKRKEVRCVSGDKPCLYLLVGEGVEFDDGSLTDIGVFILNRLLHLSSLRVVSESRLNNFLERITLKIAGCSIGLEVLANLLLSDIDCISKHTAIGNLKNKILWTLLQMSSNNGGIWGLDVQLLCELSSRDDLFLGHHVQHILSWLSHMEPVYGLTEQGELYTWRCRDDMDRMTYRTLVEHVSRFTSHSKRLRTKLIPQLENLANKSYFNICKDLLAVLG